MLGFTETREEYLIRRAPRDGFITAAGERFRKRGNAVGERFRRKVTDS